MSQDDIRSIAQSIIDLRDANNAAGIGQSATNLYQNHSLSRLMSEDFLNGYSQDGKISVIRRFFCLFITFGFFFVCLQWLICILMTGDNIYNALKLQILQYSILKSMFDVVIIALGRFLMLILFYGLVCANHFIIIALGGTVSCTFLVTKVFYYDWADTQQPVFHVLLILTSFILVWIEVWFFDCLVIPKERYARNYYIAIATNRTPTGPIFPSENRHTENLSTFYSPYESFHNSDDEDDDENDYYRKMGMECVKKANDLIQSEDWKEEKITKANDTIRSKMIDKLGKVYRLTAHVNYPAKLLLEELFYKIEEVPKWNPTLIESKIIKKIDSHTDITYQASAGGGGGAIKCRDFVNLRCWQLWRSGILVEDSDKEDSDIINLKKDVVNASIASTSTSQPTYGNIEEAKFNRFKTLSYSVGATSFSNSFCDTIDDDDVNDDFKHDNSLKNEIKDQKFKNLYISSAISIVHPAAPIHAKYIRGQNLISCWAMHEIDDSPDSCIFEWILCLDLKGFIPRFVLDNAYTSLMQDYMHFLRKHLEELSDKNNKINKNKKKHINEIL